MSSSSSVNMLRTRRKDNNVKPNRREFRSGRLDRKSSRGMIYENEELRLRTININAEIERGQYDIKKLKRENELLKKEIWCLRDEYEKLDKLLKEKDIDFSSSSTTSDSDSCSSCQEDSDDVENSQNLENVQKTNLKNLNRTFEALSVVPEESTENSDKTSLRTSTPNELVLHDEDVIKADQSYPCYDNAPTLRLHSGMHTTPKNFFSLERLDTKASEHYSDDPALYPNEYYNSNEKRKTFFSEQQENYTQFTSKKIVSTDATNFYQNIVLVPKITYSESDTIAKTGTDVLVKLDNRNFLSDQEAEPNGGDDGYISKFGDDFPRYCSNFGTNSHSTFSNGGNLEELLNDIETISQDILAISNSSQNDHSTRRCKSDINPLENHTTSKHEKPFKSELNVTLIPQPMALIGLEKYKEIHRSMNTTPSKSMENLSNQALHISNAQDDPGSSQKNLLHFQQSSTNISDFPTIHPTPINNMMEIPTTKAGSPSTFPSFLSNLRDNYINGDYFSRYNPENFPSDKTKTNQKANEATPKIFVKQASVDLPSSENDENLKIKTELQAQNQESAQTTPDTPKSESRSKIGLRKKVSIHFRGKKEKLKKSLEVPTNSIKKHSPVRDKKVQEIKNEDKQKVNHQKASCKDLNKTTSESDTKNNHESRKTVEKNEGDKKQRKSASISPDRRKVDRKCKKHKKDRLKIRRATVTSLESRDHRARSHSVNTERSNTYGGSHFLFDEYGMNSERESMSSCDTFKTRQMNFSNIPIGGKVPWCGCWGNGCI